MNATDDARHLSREQRAVLTRIQQICEYWDIEPADLRRTSRSAAMLCAPQLQRPSVKYRHPVTGETWDGQGTQPDWLRRALLKEGYRVAELLPS